MKRITEIWRNFSIWKKTFILMAALIVLTVVTFGYISYYNAARIAIDEVTSVANSTLNVLAGNLENQFYQAQTQAEQLAWNSNIRRILSQGQPESIQHQKQDYKMLCDQLVLTANNYASGLFLDSSLVYSKEHQLLFSMDDLRKNEEICEKLDSSTVASFWNRYTRKTLNPTLSTPMIACFSRILDEDDFFESVGVVAVFIPESEILKTLNAVTLTEQSVILLLDDNDMPVLDGSPKIPDDEEYYETLSVMLKPVGWKLIAYVPVSDLTRPLDSLLKYYVSLGTAIMGTVLLVSWMLAHSLTHRIRNLVMMMKNQGSSTKITLSPVTSHDEIGILQQTYNQMLLDNQHLADRLREKELSEHNAQIKALQSQINPHFLYNILDTMNWMALEAHAEDLSNAITSLADYFRMNLRKTDEPSTLEEEFKHAELYLSLQKHRMKDSLRYTMELPEEYRKMPVMKLILQPLVENAVMHGIRAKENQSGNVRVYTETDRTAVFIHVEDDGPGFSEGFTLEAFSEGQHFGLYLTEQRLKMAFGEDSGLILGKSSLGGARVTVKITK